jgi:hypothetical protein
VFIEIPGCSSHGLKMQHIRFLEQLVSPSQIHLVTNGSISSTLPY